MVIYYPVEFSDQQQSAVDFIGVNVSEYFHHLNGISIELMFTRYLILITTLRNNKKISHDSPYSLNIHQR